MLCESIFKVYWAKVMTNCSIFSYVYKVSAAFKMISKNHQIFINKLWLDLFSSWVWQNYCINIIISLLAILIAKVDGWDAKLIFSSINLINYSINSYIFSFGYTFQVLDFLCKYFRIIIFLLIFVLKVKIKLNKKTLISTYSFISLRNFSRKF